MNIFIAIVLLVVGFVMLTKGADWFVAGTSALIRPVVFERKFVLDTAMATATAVLLLVCVCNKDCKLKRTGGIIMLLAYAVYFVKLLVG